MTKTYSAYVYDKDGNQINWLDSWKNKNEMIKCAKKQKEVHKIIIYETPNYFKQFNKNGGAE